jgi:peptidoglycan/xylan/chitin deacetylase (PgdA/CDA1 family)
LKTRIFLLFAVILGSVLACSKAAAQSSPTTKPVRQPPFIILKLDDMKGESPQWERTIQFLKDQHVKSCIGIICNSLEGDKASYFSWLKAIQATGLVEFWNHGLTHAQWQEGTANVQEFKGPPYEEQKEHIVHSQQLAKEKLGITLHSFGAPFNATDDNTLKALAEDPDIKVLLYGNAAKASETPNILVLDRTSMNIEYPVGVPNLERMQHDYETLAGTRDCFVLQGHPEHWDDAFFGEFVKMVEYLKAKGVTFTTPYEYYLSRRGGGSNDAAR